MILYFTKQNKETNLIFNKQRVWNRNINICNKYNIGIYKQGKYKLTKGNLYAHDIMRRSKRK